MVGEVGYLCGHTVDAGFQPYTDFPDLEDLENLAALGIDNKKATIGSTAAFRIG